MGVIGCVGVCVCVYEFLSMCLMIILLISLRYVFLASSYLKIIISQSCNTSNRLIHLGFTDDNLFSLSLAVNKYLNKAKTLVEHSLVSCFNCLLKMTIKLLFIIFLLNLVFLLEQQPSDTVVFIGSYVSNFVICQSDKLHFTNM